MTDTNQSVASETSKANHAPQKRQTKADLVASLLRRSKGATIEEMAEATGWQPHSVRAFLTGLRKKGAEIVREQRKSGASAYRIAKMGDDA